MPPAGPLEELLELDLLSAAPYPVYRRLRGEAPVVWSDRLNAWLVSRFDDVRAVLDDTTRFSSEGRVQRGRTPPAVWDAFAGFRGFFWSDPPEYVTHREIWTKAFKPRLKGSPPSSGPPSTICSTRPREQVSLTSSPRWPSRCPRRSSSICSGCPAATATCSGASPRR